MSNDGVTLDDDSRARCERDFYRRQAGFFYIAARRQMRVSALLLVSTLCIYVAMVIAGRGTTSDRLAYAVLGVVLALWGAVALRRETRRMKSASEEEPRG